MMTSFAPVSSITWRRSLTAPATRTPLRRNPCLDGSSSRKATIRRLVRGELRTSRTTSCPASPAPMTMVGITASVRACRRRICCRRARKRVPPRIARVNIPSRMRAETGIRSGVPSTGWSARRPIRRLTNPIRSPA